jgi:hypothetical protein
MLSSSPALTRTFIGNSSELQAGTLLDLKLYTTSGVTSARRLTIGDTHLRQGFGWQAAGDQSFRYPDLTSNSLTRANAAFLLQANGLPHSSPGQRPEITTALDPASAESATHHGRKGSGWKSDQGHWPNALDPFDEAGRWPARTHHAHDPRALPWAGMNDAVGVCTLAAVLFESSDPSSGSRTDLSP